MKRGGFVVAVSFAWALGMVPACGGESIVIGGDPSDLGLSGTATSTGGFPAAGGASYETGGSTAGGTTAGGTPAMGGTPATGGVGVSGASGALATGGSAFPSGGASISTQTGGASGSGAEGAFDPYPYVTWQGGQGYRTSCPRFGDAWGFTCWNYGNEAARSCSPDGDPVCDLCSCAVPCDERLACPQGVWGHPAECVESATTAPSCFLICDDGECPTGMVCTMYPGSVRNVCMWWAELDPT